MKRHLESCRGLRRTGGQKVRKDDSYCVGVLRKEKPESMVVISLNVGIE